jgi:transcriptional regulator with XRE-family HTH domain
MHDPLRLRQRRTAKGLTGRELAAKAGVSVGTISHAENGRMPIRVTSLRAIAGALECEISDLMPADAAVAAS